MRVFLASTSTAKNTAKLDRNLRRIQSSYEELLQQARCSREGRQMEVAYWRDETIRVKAELNNKITGLSLRSLTQQGSIEKVAFLLGDFAREFADAFP